MFYSRFFTAAITSLWKNQKGQASRFFAKLKNETVFFYQFFILFIFSAFQHSELNPSAGSSSSTGSASTQSERGPFPIKRTSFGWIYTVSFLDLKKLSQRRGSSCRSLVGLRFVFVFFIHREVGLLYSLGQSTQCMLCSKPSMYHLFFPF